MAYKSQASDVETISGYFLAPVPSAGRKGDDSITSSESDDDNDEEFDSLDFSNDEAFSPETWHVKSKCQKQLKVRFKEYSSGTVHEIHGQFPLVDPWWSATLFVRDRRLVGCSAYKLRNDNLVAEEKVLMLFLNACGVHEDHRTAFENFLWQSSSPGLTFENLGVQLQEFAIYNGEIAEQIQRSLQRATGRCVQNALRYPWLYEIVPQLLPKHFLQIISLEEKILEALEYALHVRPWVFGFSSILTREFNVHGCEASFKNLYHCLNVYSQLSDTAKDALFIYNTLKDICSRQGHTFVEFQSLKKWKIQRNWKNDFLKYSVVNWTEGLAFLEEKGIVVCELLSSHSEHLTTRGRRVQSGDRIYLSRYYSAEKNIALNLGQLMFGEKFPRWNVQIDFESKHFEKIRTDEDQMQAAKLIATKPVVVLSGKGGCGKTELVGRVFAYAQNNLAQERLFDQCSLTDEELVENADKHVSLYYATKNPQTQDYSSPESLSASSNVLVKSEFSETSAAVEVCSRCREKESNLTLTPTQDYRLCKETDSTEFQDNSTAPAVENAFDDGSILLTAPTGKAAIVLGHRSGMTGYTLHQVVYSYFAWKTNPGGEPWKFASVCVLIVDECSLVSVTIFHRVLNALLRDAQLSKVVLLGDINQLPSIEPGRFLADVYEALEDAGCSITLRTNHRSESQFIVDNAERILQQQLPIISPYRRFHLISFVEDERYADNNRDAAVRKLLKGGVLPSHEKSQFVAFRRTDCDAINELCCLHYNDHSMKKCGKNGKQLLDFRPGDKVCCTRNAYIYNYTNHDLNASTGNRKAKEVPTVRLCNGEIFFIKEMHEVQENGKTKCYVVLSDLEREIKVVLGQLKNLCKLKHAWARTIHTFQGSETDALIYVVGSNVSYQNWQHVYTAVTRGKLQVHIMTRPSCLKKAISRKPIRRNTSLKERLQKIIAKQSLQESQPLSRIAFIKEESKSFNMIYSSGTKSSSSETSTETDSTCDQGLDFVTPVKTSLLQDDDAKSVSGGKRKQSDSSSVIDGSPAVKHAKENSLANSLVSPIRRQLSMSNINDQLR